ncbi:MAG: 2,3-bisphosphoglycerate-independent phosphoglycerate mutase [Candidatus Pacebacteria bacterium]|nr:2,3-bisphosphoglycerate-independent phosphoglycerate mutase [Candidatus Paceibacterota bacterium]
MKKILFIVIDGLGDNPVKMFGGKTPLEAAKTPNLDLMAKNGFCGSLEPFMFESQDAPTSEDAHIALFGFDPKRYSLGRGIFEALGAGIPLKSKDVAIRINFATVDSNLTIKDRRAGRIENTQALINDLNRIKIKGVKIFVKKAWGYRAVLRLRSTKDISPEITSNDPREIFKQPLKIKAKNKSRSAIFTAQLLNEFVLKSHEVLKNHFINQERKKSGLPPANFLLLRGAGRFKKLPSFKKVWAMKACCVAGGNLYKGIAKFLGMEVVKVKGANGGINTNLKEKINTAKKCLKKNDFVFLHIKAADCLAEDGNCAGKKSFIEKIDRHLKPLLNLNNSDIIITCDHRTDCNKKMHAKGNVPFLIYENQSNGIESFSEKSCNKPVMPSRLFIKFIVDLQKK